MNAKATLDVYNFESWTAEEFQSNLKRLGVDCHNDMVGKEVYYSRPVYGIHKVIEWNGYSADFKLELDGHKFWCNPFMIHNINTK